MLLDALIAASLIAAASLSGALVFGDTRRLVGLSRYVVPTAVGVFLSLVLYELVPETLAAAPEWGGVVVALGFMLFYVLAYRFHKAWHHQAAEERCERKEAAMLLLVGDAIHNLADGVILASAFLINPAVGVATAVGLALHEIPQEIVEFGVLVRAGYSRVEAALRNLLSASTIILGVLFTFAVAELAQDFVWVITGLAAGALLYLAASDLLPRIHGNLANYGSVTATVTAIVLGFSLMTGILYWSHETFMPHEHDEGIHHTHEPEAGVEWHMRNGIDVSENGDPAQLE